MSSIRESIKKQRPNGTAWYTFQVMVGSDQPLQMEVQYAGKGNTGYRSAQVKAAIEAIEKPTVVGKLTEAKFEANVAVSTAFKIQLLSSSIVVGLRNCFEHGKPVPCTPEKVAEALQAIADELGEGEITEFLDWCRERSNFPNAAETTGVELGKG